MSVNTKIELVNRWYDITVNKFHRLRATRMCCHVEIWIKCILFRSQAFAHWTRNIGTGNGTITLPQPIPMNRSTSDWHLRERMRTTCVHTCGDEGCLARETTAPSLMKYKLILNTPHQIAHWAREVKAYTQYTVPNSKMSSWSISLYSIHRTK